MNKISTLFNSITSALKPSEIAWQRAAIMIAVVWVAILLFHMIPFVFVDFTGYKALGFLSLTISLLTAGLIAALVLRMIAALPRRFFYILIIPLPLLAIPLTEIGPKALAVLSIGGLLSVALISGSLGSIAKAGFKPRQQKLLLVTLAFACITLVATIALVFLEYENPNPALAGYELPDRTLNLADPAVPGAYQVLYTTYGSGKDLHRVEFGESVGFLSSAVDGSKLIDNWEKTIGWARTRYWGFDTG
jgi:hypothetical protein